MKPQTTINKIDEILNTDNNRNKIYSFLNKFSQCEVYVRYYLEMYYGENVDPNDIKLIREDIKSALLENGICIEDERIITFIFGDTDNTDSRTCKRLRNKITHKLNKAHIKEVIRRYDELISKMDEFIQLVNEQS